MLPSAFGKVYQYGVKGSSFAVTVQLGVTGMRAHGTLRWTENSCTGW